MIQLFKCKIHDEAIEAAVRVLKSGWTGLGSETEAFEKEFAEYVGAAGAVATDSCTSALRLSVELAIPPHSRVLTTPLTFISTNHVILQKNCIPVFVDIDPTTGNMDLEMAERYLEEKHNIVGGLIVVHYGGLPLDLDYLYFLSKEYNIPIIEDAAHAAGAQYDRSEDESYMIGGFLETGLCCFSFQAVKNLPLGDGGMITTQEPSVVPILKSMRWLGVNKSTSDRTTDKYYSWDYDVTSVGFKANMNDITASMGREQLKHLAFDNTYRHMLYLFYLERLLESCEHVTPIVETESMHSAHHLMVVKFTNKEMRDRVMEKLSENEIGYGLHYRPSYYYYMYEDCEKLNDCKNTEDFFSRCLSLPMHLDLTIGDVDRICDVIKEGIRSC